MPKVQSHGKIIIDGKEVDLRDFDDSRANHTHTSGQMAKAAEDELEKEILRQSGHTTQESFSDTDPLVFEKIKKRGEQWDKENLPFGKARA
jgi:hypothetical protein